MTKSIPIKNTMESKLKEALDLHHFEVKDFTGRHLNHNLHDGGFHLEAVIVSEDFQNNSLVSFITRRLSSTLTNYPPQLPNARLSHQSCQSSVIRET